MVRFHKGRLKSYEAKALGDCLENLSNSLALVDGPRSRASAGYWCRAVVSSPSRIKSSRRSRPKKQISVALWPGWLSALPASRPNCISSSAASVSSPPSVSISHAFSYATRASPAPRSPRPLPRPSTSSSRRRLQLLPCSSGGRRPRGSGRSRCPRRSQPPTFQRYTGWIVDRNVIGGELEPCGTDPVTGFYRDGCCKTYAPHNMIADDHPKDTK